MPKRVEKAQYPTKNVENGQKSTVFAQIRLILSISPLDPRDVSGSITLILAFSRQTDNVYYPFPQSHRSFH